MIDLLIDKEVVSLEKFYRENIIFECNTFERSIL